MLNLVVMAVGIGLFVNLLLGELFGLVAGGMVVAGYLALNLNLPVDIALTVAAALITLLFVRGLSAFVIMYGRRTFAAMVLVGFLVGVSLNMAFEAFLPFAPILGTGHVLPPGSTWGIYRTIGFILPGLIALWMERQGIFATVCTLLVGAGLVRLTLILLVGTQIGPVTEVYFASSGMQP